MARELTAGYPRAGSQRAVVLDTNIVLDLLVFSDPAAQALAAALDAGDADWIAAPCMRTELARVLAYPYIASRMESYGVSAQLVLARFDAGARVVDAAPRAHAICRDPDDQVFIDLAVAHQALLLSKDKAVLCLHKRLLAYGAQVARRLLVPPAPEDSPNAPSLTKGLAS